LTKIAVNNLSREDVTTLKLLLPTADFEGFGGGEFVITFNDDASLQHFREWEKEKNNVQD
jgi:hypothetical protein